MISSSNNSNLKYFIPLKFLRYCIFCTLCFLGFISRSMRFRSSRCSSWISMEKNTHWIWSCL